MSHKVGKHLAERIFKYKCPLTALVLSPCNLTFLSVLEFAVARKCSRIMFWQKSHYVEHPVKAFAAQLMPFTHASYSSCRRPVGSLRFSVALGKITKNSCVHRYYSASGSLNTVYSLNIVTILFTFHQSPAYTVGAEV